MSVGVDEQNLTDRTGGTLNVFRRPVVGASGGNKLGTMLFRQDKAASRPDQRAVRRAFGKSRYEFGGVVGEQRGSCCLPPVNLLCRHGEMLDRYCNLTIAHR